MKAVLMSIQPKWCELIANGKKTVEVRKTKPRLETPFKVYIYCTLPPKSEFFWHHNEEGRRTIGEYAHELIRLPNGQVVYDYGMRLACEEGEYTQDNFLCRKVIGEFVCDKVEQGHILWVKEQPEYYDKVDEKTQLTYRQMLDYLGEKGIGYFWHISDLVIYDKPKPFTDFWRCNYSFDCGVCDYFDGFTMSCEKPKRPPQSWCYVERSDNNGE